MCVFSGVCVGVVCVGVSVRVWSGMVCVCAMCLVCLCVGVCEYCVCGVFV